MVMKNFTIKEHFDFFIFTFQNFMIKETLDIHRKGYVYFEDIKKMSLKNFDMKLGKTLNNVMQNNFPQRIKAIYVLNYGIIIKSLMTIAKLIIKKKIIDRVRLVTLDTISDYVDKSQIVKEFGGEIEFTMSDMINLN
jgi:hypothetical protein